MIQTLHKSVRWRWTACAATGLLLAIPVGTFAQVASPVLPNTAPILNRTNPNARQNTAPSAQGNTAPSAQGNTAPSAQGNTAPSARVNTAPTAQLNTAPNVPLNAVPNVPQNTNPGVNRVVPLPSVGGNAAGGVGLNFAPNAGQTVVPGTGVQVPNPAATSPVLPVLPRSPSVRSPTLAAPAMANPAASATVDASAGAAATSANNFGLGLNPGRRGLSVGSVAGGSLSALAGFQVGDEILAVDRSWIRSQADLANQFRIAQSNGRAWVLVNRNGQQEWVNLSLTNSARPALGVFLLDRGGAVRISNVAPGSVAFRAGLRAGDQVLTVNGVPVTSSEDVTAAVRTAASSDGMLEMQIRRNGIEQTLSANLTANASANANGNGADASLAANTALDLQNLRQTVQNLRSDLDGLVPGAGEATQIPLRDMHRQAELVSRELNSLTQDQVARTDERIMRVRDQIRSLNNQLNQFAQQATGDLKARIEQARERAAEIEQQLADAPRTAIGNGASIQPRGGAALRGELGFTVAGPATHLVVTAVQEGSIAARAGLQPGDRIIAINSAPVAGAGQFDADLQAAVSERGSIVVLFDRNGETRSTKLARPSTDAT